MTQQANDINLLEKSDMLTLREASEWATSFLGRSISESNISYLVQYGRILKRRTGRRTVVSRTELKQYYEEHRSRQKESWKEKLGSDLNWQLSFDHLREIHTTKHVHRLHPYKGKFIPQLAEYFLDGHTDEFKSSVIFRPGDIILDPFCGSGTTLVQANELGLHAVGVDVSAFNALLSNVKVVRHNRETLTRSVADVTGVLEEENKIFSVEDFDRALTDELSHFNSRFFPSPEFKRSIHQKAIDESSYGDEKTSVFLRTYYNLARRYKVDVAKPAGEKFLDRWYMHIVREQINSAQRAIQEVDDVEIRNALSIFLSRSVRSTRATTHSDLVTLQTPQTTPYYCAKHMKICKPIFSLVGMWKRYALDGTRRLADFDSLRTETDQLCVIGDSRTIDIGTTVESIKPVLGQRIRGQKCRGIFSSPPYVGLIDYHEQHAYAYDLLGLPRADELEIGPLMRGKGKDARESYGDSIAMVLRNTRKVMVDDFDVFLVANDKYNLYPAIATRAGMVIVQEFKRPVLNRAEDKNAYAETIFHLKPAH